MRKRANDLLGQMILAAFAGYCWLVRIPANYEQARKWMAR